MAEESQKTSYFSSFFAEIFRLAALLDDKLFLQQTP
jgi:hypothetical protein